jgi:hypothetical protein
MTARWMATACPSGHEQWWAWHESFADAAADGREIPCGECGDALVPDALSALRAVGQSSLVQLLRRLR